MEALEKLKAITKIHYICVIDDEIVLSNELMELFKCDRVIPKEDAEEYFKWLSYEPKKYHATKEFLDIAIDMVNGTLLNVPE